MNSTNYINSTNATLSSPSYPQFYYPNEIRVTMRAIQSLTAFGGILGNLLVCAVILSRSNRSSIRYYLFSLAIADLGILLLIFPTLVVRMEPIPWPFGVFGCTYVISIAEISYPASIWTMTLIAMSRYRNIASNMTQVAPLGHHDRAFNPKKINISLICVWLAAFVCGSLPLFFILKYEPTFKKCIPVWPRENGFMYVQAYLITTVLLYYFIPLAIISATYYGIRKRLNHSIRFNRTIPGVGAQNAITLHSTKAKKVLTPLVLAFAILMLPITIARLIILYEPNVYKFRYFQVMYDIFLICIILNSAIDPLIYYMVNSEFRKGIQEMGVYCTGRTVLNEPGANTITMTRPTRIVSQ